MRQTGDHRWEDRNTSAARSWRTTCSRSATWRSKTSWVNHLNSLPEPAAHTLPDPPRHRDAELEAENLVDLHREHHDSRRQPEWGRTASPGTSPAEAPPKEQQHRLQTPAVAPPPQPRRLPPPTTTGRRPGTTPSTSRKEQGSRGGQPRRAARCGPAAASPHPRHGSTPRDEGDRCRRDENHRARPDLPPYRPRPPQASAPPPPSAARASPGGVLGDGEARGRGRRRRR